jgi:cytochrome c-type biogenesis protein CcmH/NrfG
MAAPSKGTKGYIKTENLILSVLVSLAVGFVGGVVFSAYRSSSTPAGPSNAPVASVPQTQEQKETLAALIQATQTTPDNINAWAQLGHAYFDSGEHALAIAAYEKSLSLDGKRPDVWTDLGVMYRRNGNPDKAIECFNRAIALNQRHEVARFNKGVVLMHDKNDPKGALQSWEELLRINPQAKTPSGEPLKTMVKELKKNSPS